MSGSGKEGPSVGPPGRLAREAGEGSAVGTHLVGLSSLLGPGYQYLPWGQWAQEAPGYQLDLGEKCH